MVKDKNFHENKIEWCKNQSCGIKIIKPDNNLSKQFFKKSENALVMLKFAIQKKQYDWIATTAYYARYFSFYAILQRCGIKSEIHDCTIELLNFLFVEHNIFSKKIYDELQISKKFRIDMQYYVSNEINFNLLISNAKLSIDFVLKMKEVNNKLTNSQIIKTRNMAKKM